MWVCDHVVDNHGKELKIVWNTGNKTDREIVNGPILVGH